MTVAEEIKQYQPRIPEFHMELLDTYRKAMRIDSSEVNIFREKVRGFFAGIKSCRHAGLYPMCIFPMFYEDIENVIAIIHFLPDRERWTNEHISFAVEMLAFRDLFKQYQ